MRARILLLVWLALPGCRDAAPPPSASAAPAPSAILDPASPEEVVERIHALRLGRRYSELEQFVVTERRGEPSALLLSVEQVVATGASLRRAADARFGRDIGPRLDLGPMVENLGLLSTSLRVIRVEQHEDSAIVVIQEADHVPLVYEHFERREGQWLWRPDPADRRTPEGLLQLSRLLRQTADRIAAGRLTLAQFDHVVRLQVAPLCRAIHSQG